MKVVVQRLESVATAADPFNHPREQKPHEKPINVFFVDSAGGDALQLEVRSPTRPKPCPHSAP